MKQKVWDIYINNCFMQRTKYMSFMEMIQQRYKANGYIVKIYEKEIDC